MAIPITNCVLIFLRQYYSTKRLKELYRAKSGLLIKYAYVQYAQELVPVPYSQVLVPVQYASLLVPVPVQTLIIYTRMYIMQPEILYYLHSLFAPRGVMCLTAI
jgi:hypothetical protein